MTIKPPADPIPDGRAFGYFLAAAVAGAVAGGLLFNFLKANDPLRKIGL